MRAFKVTGLFHSYTAFLVKLSNYLSHGSWEHNIIIIIIV